MEQRKRSRPWLGFRAFRRESAALTVRRAQTLLLLALMRTELLFCVILCLLPVQDAFLPSQNL